MPRLLRVQFTPIMMAPVTLGAAIAFHATGRFIPEIFLLALAGSVCLHLAANGIDDVYDFLNGTDAVAEKMFPAEAPGWKPIPRGLFSVADAFKVSYLLYGVSVAIGIALSFLVGWFAIGIAIPGILLSYFYTAPPLRLDYRGLGLGEISILLSFGPIPAAGAYYVMAGGLSLLPFVVALPSGLLTVVILVSHDLIYYDAYSQSGKNSLAVMIGKRNGAVLSIALSVLAYALLILLVLSKAVPPYGLAALGALPLLLLLTAYGVDEMSPPRYGTRTTIAFLGSSLFTFLLAAGIFLG